MKGTEAVPFSFYQVALPKEMKKQLQALKKRLSKA
jgi:hypothetical protein